MNIASYTGLRPVGDRNHSGFGGVVAYFLPSTEPTVAAGDIIIKEEGLNPSAIFGYAKNELPVASVLDAEATTTPITGVVVGVAPIDPYVATGDQGLTGKARVIFVQDSLDAEFAVRATHSATIVVGQNADIVYAAPDTKFGISRVSLKSSAATSTLPLKVVRPLNEVGNDTSADYAEYVVRINNSSEMTLSTGFGTQGS